MESMRRMLENEKEGRRIVTDRLVSVEQLLKDLVNREATKSHDDQEVKRQKLEYNLGLTSDSRRKPVDHRMNQGSHGSKSGGHGYQKESKVCNKTPLHSNKENKEVCFFLSTSSPLFLLWFRSSHFFPLIRYFKKRNLGG